METEVGTLPNLDYHTVNNLYKKLKPLIRKTPILQVDPHLTDQLAIKSLALKLENQQITGAFKIRGALSAMMDLTEHKMVAASAGNHGLGVGYGAMILNKKAIIFLPENTDEDKIAKLKSMNAELVITGDCWDESHYHALSYVKKNRAAYIHPFADEKVIAGQGTIAIELIEELGSFDTVIAAVGGGGLINGISSVLKSYNPDIRVIGVEPSGAPTIYNSIRNNTLADLKKLSTNAKTLAVKKSTKLNVDLCKEFVDELHLVTDDESQKALEYMWRHFGMAVEFSSALPLAAILSKKIALEKDERVVSIVCAAGSSLFRQNSLVKSA